MDGNALPQKLLVRPFFSREAARPWHTHVEPSPRVDRVSCRSASPSLVASVPAVWSVGRLVRCAGPCGATDVGGSPAHQKDILPPPLARRSSVRRPSPRTGEDGRPLAFTRSDSRSTSSVGREAPPTYKLSFQATESWPLCSLASNSSASGRVATSFSPRGRTDEMRRRHAPST